MLLGGALLTLVIVLAQQYLGAVAMGVFTLFMAYWTSPLRSGPHTALETARARGGRTAVVLWAPGNPGSARLQAAFRSPREDVVWVNVHRDPAARTLLDEHGGDASLPLVLVGEDMAPAASAAELMALQDRADGA